MTTADIDTDITHWYNTIHTAIRHNIPTTHYKPLPPPPLSHQTLLLMIRFNHIRQHAARYGWHNQLYYDYRLLQQQLRERLTEENNAHWSNLMISTAAIHKDPATFWRKIKNLMGNINPSPHYLFDQQNNKIKTPLGKERLLRNLWTEVYAGESPPEDNEAEEHDTRINNYIEQHRHRTIPHAYIDTNILDSQTPLTIPFTVHDTKQIIKGLKKSSPGSSGINKTILKHLPDNAIARLTSIFNFSLAAGYFPDIWKKATVRFIPKSGKDHRQPSNYRPISLLEVPGKFFERLLNTRLRDHLDFNDKYNHHQYGFRVGRGTTDALALITEQIAHYKADGGQCHIVMRDISKAFDKVWHLGLKFKILHLGLPEVVERLLCNFLDVRKARIKVDTVLGDFFNLACGVPQGSVLSPTLFVVYTHDSPPSNTGFNISYADDITQLIHYPGPSKEMLRLRTQREIENINQYEKLWRIKTNLNKFTILRTGATTGNEIEISGEQIPFHNVGKTLGLNITNTGYNTHINTRNKLGRRKLTQLYRFKEMPMRTKLHLIKTLILPLLDYPSIPTHTMCKTQLKKLQITQNKALRFAANQRYPYTMNTIELHDFTKTTPINIRLYQRALKTWEKLELHDNEHFLSLQENITNITTFNTRFPSSLINIMHNNEPDPIYN